MDERCIIDLKTKTIRTDVNLNRFLYIEWNSEQPVGGGGITHMRYSIQSLLLYYLYNDLYPRTFIFSDEWRLDFKTHSPKSQKTIVDIREYFEVKFNIASKLGQPINIYFDYKGIFRDNFSTNETIGIARRANRKKNSPAGLTKVTANNKHIIQIKELQENQILQFNYNFWCGCWHTGRSLGKKILSNQEIILNGNQHFFEPIKKLTDIAIDIVCQIKQCSNATNDKFYVVRLRRGDIMELDNCLAKSSEISFVIKQLKKICPDGSLIYIMSNGTDEYIFELKSELQSTFNVFSKHDFLKLNQMGDEDNFASYTVEMEILKLSNKQITNRDLYIHHQKSTVFSLVYEYINQSRELIITPTGDLLVKIAEEGNKLFLYNIMFTNPVTLAYGLDNNYIYKDNVLPSTTITFNNATFGQDPAPTKAKFGFIKIGNKKNFVKIGEENISWFSDTPYSAIYGKNEKFYCKLFNKGRVKFNNATFGDPLPGKIKECYIIQQG